MKIGYPCLNLSIKANTKTFRLASFSSERFAEAVDYNLDSLERIIAFNVDHHLLNLRISSDIIPFASHPVCTINWQEQFKERFARIGDSLRRNGFRVSMHPDQFTLINSPTEAIFEASVRELEYHATVLDLMGLDTTHKVQIHVGGVYGDKVLSSQRFIQRFALLPLSVRQRLVIENDDRLYSLGDCLFISKATGIPVLFDTFHHELNNNGESLNEAMRLATATWGEDDGILMIDYSSQAEGKRIGAHADHIDAGLFKTFLTETGQRDFDIMLEIKDKESSAVEALSIIAG